MNRRQRQTTTILIVVGAFLLGLLVGCSTPTEPDQCPMPGGLSPTAGRPCVVVNDGT